MSWMLVSLVTIAVAFPVSCRMLNALTFKPIERFVEDRGYPIEKHVIDTPDGFSLTYHRVPHGRQGPGHGHGHPVLLAHGVLQSSAVFLAVEGGLGTANFTGSMCFHEMGKVDLPAAIKHILKETKRPSLTYVGFSMGTTMFWVLADSWGPLYMDRVDTMVAIAPVARPSGMKILQKPALYNAFSAILKTFKRFHTYEIRDFHWYEGMIIRGVCSKGEENQLCIKLLSGMVGLIPDNIDYRDTYLKTQYMPAGTSVKTVRHFLQIGKQAKFQQYDYGERRNLKKYDYPTPPAYDLKKVTCPVFFITSDKDDFSTKEDVEWLAKQLPEEPKILFYDEVKDFNHLDYFYFKHVKINVLKPLVDFLTERTKNIPILDVNISEEST